MTPRRTPLSQLEQGIPFEHRHIGPDGAAQAKMLAQVGYGSLDDLTAAAQKAGESVPDYVRQSIEDPNAVVVEGYQPGVMPQNFKDSLSSEEIDALVAYVGGEEAK